MVSVFKMLHLQDRLNPSLAIGYPDQVKLFSWSELDNQIQTIKEKMVIWQEN